MNILKHIPSVLLGLVFFAFGLAYFLKLMPTPPMEGNMQAFMKLFGETGYMNFVKVFEVIGGALLFHPRTRAIGICIITPIALNILAFELFISKQPGIGVALVLVSVAAIYFEKDKFKSLMA
jgi:putative oxidoreductase